MNSIFQELLHKGILANYMDDFVILAKDMKELEKRTIWFLKIAEKHNLCFKQSKCDFNMEEIPILGVVVGRGQVQMEADKVKAVKEWKTPTKIKEVESFLGFANFYKWFIKNFSHTAKPLNCYRILWTLTIFLFFNFSDFILILFFLFFFGWWRGMWYCSHMTCHMMWCHRPRTW